MQQAPKSVGITGGLILLNAVFWLAYALITVLSGGHLAGVPAPVKWAIVLLALVSAGVLAGIAVFLRRRSRFAFYAGILLLALIAVLSVTDEFGWLDLVSLLISLLPLGLLLKDRAWYLKLHGR